MNTKELKLVTFEQAKRLKALGFYWETQVFFDLSGNAGSYNFSFHNFNRPHENSNTASAPIVALALKWFRDEKKMYFDGGYYIPEKKYRFFYGSLNRILSESRTKEFDTYEASESALLDELLKVIENEK